MTLSAPIKIIVSCFAVAALVATTMSGSGSAGLKGARKLQSGVFASPNPTINGVFVNSNSIFAAVLPPLTAGTIAANTITSQAAFGITPGDGTLIANTVTANSALGITSVAGAGTLIANTVTTNAALGITPGDGNLIANTVTANAARAFTGFSNP
jgi:hypothetical protein